MKCKDVLKWYTNEIYMEMTNEQFQVINSILSKHRGHNYTLKDTNLYCKNCEKIILTNEEIE